ncbi:2-amino-4-hydroxy-6-hydroxymethyldihydropteridine diphosphokinase [Paenibacillus abyssi]|uniref:2-amino-4-hydroxy-6-hydroxymethyldihydropteridine diphosphokinase n=1 Tax=Paenibacillus abyssi TaxID=1340531 RepID=A0A917LHS6_9BACL|nr:2-amino-4-hydroxy-6-hydroxymethyldihydropteridine diphosphokinase [Paenibacillus abyssi]GGG24913.1 2-amino-4-hydroxy-6-hydroxymethyldihydropteridine pyrophosphokinase [Paenibacillus abyssi]
MDKSFPPGAEPESPVIKPVTAIIALGSNLGDREGLLLQALRLLDEHASIQVQHVSGIYETDPVGFTEQPAFLNMAAAVAVSLPPLELLRQMLAVEGRLGRVREQRWGPRTIDLDLIYYEGVEMDTEELTLPHPRMLERAFVLVPMRDVVADTEVAPSFRESVESAAAEAQRYGKEGITLWNTINWRSGSAHSGS